MKSVLAYFVAVFIGPILVIFIMMQLPAPKNDYNLVHAFFETCIGGFASVVFGKLIFGIVGVHYDSSVVFWIGIFFIANFMVGYFIKNTSHEIATLKLMGGIGTLCGVILVGFLLVTSYQQSW